jgi:hypothetical protein
VIRETRYQRPQSCGEGLTTAESGLPWGPRVLGEFDEVAVRVADVGGALAPVPVSRGGDSVRAGGDELGVGSVDVVDLEAQFEGGSGGVGRGERVDAERRSMASLAYIARRVRPVANCA